MINNNTSRIELKIGSKILRLWLIILSQGSFQLQMYFQRSSVSNLKFWQFFHMPIFVRFLHISSNIDRITNVMRLKAGRMKVLTWAMIWSLASFKPHTWFMRFIASNLEFLLFFTSTDLYTFPTMLSEWLIGLSWNLGHWNLWYRQSF